MVPSSNTYKARLGSRPELKIVQINLIAVGKIKEKYLMNGIAEYTRRLSRYCTLRVSEVADEKAPENLSESDMTAVKDEEGERILKQIKEGMYVIVMDLEGKMFSSEAFAAKIEQLSLHGNSQVGSDYWRITGSFKCGSPASGRKDQLFKNDLSPSVDAVDLIGAAVQGISN
jgi:rRNA large subunit m3Psi methyltransferase RlmH